jgi:hypothetical protein
MGARFIEIDLKAGYKRGGMGKKHKHVKVLSPAKMKLKINKDQTWELVPPFHPEWEYYIPDYPTGTWTESSFQLTINGQDGQQCFALRSPDKGAGIAFYGEAPKYGMFPFKSTWRRTARGLVSGKSGCWSGLALKGSAGVVIQGEEVVCLVRSWDNPGSGAWFNVLSSRLGLVGGFTAGVALVVVTGFPNINELHNHLVKDWDWSLSLGAKLSGFAKLGKTGPVLVEMAKRINRVEDLVQAIKAGKNEKEIIGMGKAAYDNFGGDFEEKSVIVIDIPLGGVGVEMGVYIYRGTCKLLSKW